MLPTLDREFQISREVLVTLFRQVPNATIGNTLGSVLLCAALWRVEAHGWLIAWLLLVIAASAVRYGCYRLFLRRAEELDGPGLTRWRRVMQATVALQTVAWSLCLVMIWPAQPQYRAVVVGTLVGVMAVGAVLLSIDRRVLLSYQLPVVLPLMVRLIADGLHFELWLAVLTAFYMLLLCLASARQVHTFRDTVRLRLEMAELSRIDPLTGLANRRVFDDALESLWRQCRRARTPLALVCVDVDHFKAYNDHYGHPGGDLVLRQVAQVLQHGAERSVDCVARIGGEEFALLLPDTDAGGARRVAEKLLAEVRALGIPHEKSPRATVSMSVGLAVCVPAAGDSPARLVEAADAALYRAKSGGRDRCETA